jgi:hypothetical protein
MIQKDFWPSVYRSKNYSISYFMQDGARPHTANKVQDWLKSKFGDRFLDKTKWPARSPDLNPCDYFLWGHLKSKIYGKMPKTIKELREKIEFELKNISSLILTKVFENMKKRCEDILIKKGCHIE